MALTAPAPSRWWRWSELGSSSRERYLTRPPRRSFVFTYLHGAIDWRQVARKPTFKALWPILRKSLSEADFLAAHNARFDQSVLNACCAAAGVAPPPQRFVCTVRLARSTWGIYPTRLPDVCRFLGIRLHHHDPLSDAEACTRIVLASQEQGKKSTRVPIPVSRSPQYSP